MAMDEKFRTWSKLKMISTGGVPSVSFFQPTQSYLRNHDVTLPVVNNKLARVATHPRLPTS